MKIVRISATPFVLPYAKEFRMATGSISEAAHVLVAVETDEGITGYAEAVSRPMIYGESQESVVAAVERWFGPAFAGTDPFAVESAQALLGAVAGNNTVKGAIDMALHDIRGKALGVPVWRLLGGAATGLRVTRMLGMGTPEAVAAEAAEAAADHGISSFKVKVDRDVAVGVATVRAVRDAVGGEATIYVDANQSLSAESAVQAVGALAETGVQFLEEPVPATDLVGRARVAAASPIPVLADESAASVQEAAVQLTHGSARALSIKTARTGFTESARIVGLAAGLHARTVIGSQGDSAIGAICGATFGAAFDSTSREPAELDYFLGLTDQIVTRTPTITDGRVDANQDLPGTGVDIDADKLAHYRCDL